MVSSLHALGMVMVEDLKLGEYCNLNVEATQGKCILFALPHSEGHLLLAAVADQSLLWGHCLAVCRLLCEFLDTMLQNALRSTRSPATREG
jgi:hypothetical protein